ncbi:hypothetical protein FHS27_002671 [Rhodopirellula rubra]|uniref:Uncharacterized protein n=1 Tax=Aporhodopirellula rubra TaxID=980271 RepID=A0A7W5H4X3_9BACT|nr:hypothetical protein [Aporhodopirellula rubra]
MFSMGNPLDLAQADVRGTVTNVSGYRTLFRSQPSNRIEVGYLVRAETDRAVGWRVVGEHDENTERQSILGGNQSTTAAIARADVGRANGVLITLNVTTLRRGVVRSPSHLCRRDRTGR